MEQNSLNVLDNCRNLKQSVISARMDIADHQLQNNQIFREYSRKLQGLQIGERSSNKTESKMLGNALKVECFKVENFTIRTFSFCF